MTQPINWDQVANALVYSKGKANNWFWDASLGVADIAAALRDAEKAGMERAAVIAAGHSCEEAVSSVMSNGGSWGDAAWAAGEDIATAIRSAKETNP
jgi:hypothetical protein